MHYVIYIPKARGASPEHLAKVGIASLGTDRQPEWSEVFAGAPDGGHGMMGVWRTGNVATDASFTPADKTWTKAPGGGNYWLGVQGEMASMTPACLARKTQRPGVWVELADGRQWAIPLVDRLPHRYGLGDNGEMTRRPAAEFEAFVEAAARHATKFCKFVDAVDRLRATNPELAVGDGTDGNGPEFEITLTDTWRFCVDALAINYRVNDAIVDWLELLDDGAMVRIVGACLELPAILDVRREKKTARVTIPVG